MQRCWWCAGDEMYQRYHDDVWGRVERDDQKLFEMLSLELFQAGLSWLTILRKQANFRKAFASWDIQAIAQFGDRDFERLMADTGIVRNRKKIDAVINNAKRYEDVVVQYGSLANLVWQFEPKERQIPPGGFTRETLPLMVDEAKQMSKHLKKLGFRFTGPMTCMSFMQAVGIINDHVAGCALCPY